MGLPAWQMHWQTRAPASKKEEGEDRLWPPHAHMKTHICVSAENTGSWTRQHVRRTWDASWKSDARMVLKCRSSPTESKSPGGGAGKLVFLKNAWVTQLQIARYEIFQGEAGFWELLAIKQPRKSEATWTQCDLPLMTREPWGSPKATGSTFTTSD